MQTVTSDSMGLVDFAVGLADSIFRVPEGQVKLFGQMFEEIQITAVQKDNHDEIIVSIGLILNSLIILSKNFF